MTNFLIKLFIKDSENVTDKKVREKYGSLSGAVGIFCNILLCIIKLFIGFVTQSISIVADGLNNLSDIGSSVVTLIGFKLSSKPADRDHPYGHGRIEYMSAFIVAVLILLVGIELLSSSVKALISGDAAPQYGYFSLIALAVSIVIKLWMFFFNRYLAKRIDSKVIFASAQDSINDVIATLAILIAALITVFAALPFNLDAVMAIGVALFILYSGFMSAKETLDEILGGPPQAQLVAEIERLIVSFDGFLGVHDLLVHNYGPGRQFASVHVEVPHDIDIVECHEKIDLCEKLVAERTGVELVIHMDPIDNDNAAVTGARESLLKALNEIDSRLSLHDFRMTPTSSKRTNLIFDVVVPSDFKISQSQLNDLICQKAKQINPTYCCVITFDNDYTGK